MTRRTVERPLKLMVRLRLVEIGHVPPKCIDEISAAISELRKVSKDWSFRFSDVDNENDETGPTEHRIRITHTEIGRQDAIGNTNATLIVLEKLCQELCDPKGALSLNKIITHKNLVLQPYLDGTHGASEWIDTIFGQKFIANVVRHTSEAQAHFQDIEAIEANPLTRNGTKWFRGAMRVGIVLCDFLELYRDHLELIPVADIAASGQGLFNVVAKQTIGGVTADTLAKANVLLMILKQGAEIAPWLRSTLDMQLAKLDKKALAKTLVEAFDKVDSATSNVINSLKQLNEGLASGQIPIGTIDKSLQHLTIAMKETGPLFNAAQKEKDKNLVAAVGLGIATGISILATIGLFVCNPPAGSVLGSVLFGELLVAEGLGVAAGATALGTGAGTIVKCCTHQESKQLRQKIHKIGDNCHQIWLFLTLIMFRRTGRLTDDDERLIAFAQLMARTFQTVDVLRNWNDPGYVKATVEIEMDRLEKSVGDIKLKVEPKRDLAAS